MAGRLKLGQLLISKGLIGPDQLASALGEQEQWGSRLGMTLVRMGFLDEEVLIRVLAQQLQVPVARIQGKTINREMLDLVPAELAEKYRCLPLFVREEAGRKKLFLGMEDPSDLLALDELSFRVPHPLTAVLVAPTDLEDALQRHYHGAALMPGRSPEIAPLPAAAPPAPAQAPALAPQLPAMDALQGGLPGAAADDDDPNGLSFSAAGQEPLSGFDTAPFGDDDPELGGFAEEPFGGAEDESNREFAASAFGGDLAGDLSDGPAAAASAPVAGSAAPRPSARGSLDASVLLQALAQLLVEKGVIGREEFAERVRRLAGRTGEH